MNQCTFSGADLDLDTASISTSDLNEWECQRRVWRKHDEVNDRCVWHANTTDKPPAKLEDTVEGGDLHGAIVPSETDLTDISFPDKPRFIGANLSGVNLAGADLIGANLVGADLSRADLGYPDLPEVKVSDIGPSTEGLSDSDLPEMKPSDIDLSGAILVDADLSEANLQDADLSGVDFTEADLPGADLHEADLPRANLRGADLRGANLQGADLSGASLRQATLDKVGLNETTLEDVEVNEGTTARPPSLWEQEADEAAESGLLTSTGLRRLRALRRPKSDPDTLQKAEQQYRRIERLYRENDLRPNPMLAIQEKHARRKRALSERNYTRWLRRAFSRWVLGYGLRIGPILGVMGVVIVVCTLAYPLVGFEDGTLAANVTEASTVEYETVPPSLSWETAVTLARSLYFSTITFSTLGYGDLSPTGWARALATAESFIGALSLAYLVSVLSRRAIR